MEKQRRCLFSSFAHLLEISPHPCSVNHCSASFLVCAHTAGLSNSLDSFTAAAAALPAGNAALNATLPAGQHVRAALALLAETLCVVDASSSSSSASASSSSASSASSSSSSVASVSPLLLSLAHHPLALAAAAHAARHAGAENPSRAVPLFGAAAGTHVAASLAAKVHIIIRQCIRHAHMCIFVGLFCLS
jgi:hypothetical protein